MTNLSKNTTQQAFVKAIQAEVSQVLGIQLDGQFSVIVHPQGYPYFIVYGENSYYNEATLNLVDQTICINDNGFGTFSNTRLSQLYNDILNNIEFKLSDEDQNLLKKQEQWYEQVSQRVVSIYERDVEIITKKKLVKVSVILRQRLAMFNILSIQNMMDIPKNFPPHLLFYKVNIKYL